MEITQLKYFLGVANELHFSRAAEKLNITQPALSRQVQQLEEELGVVLFERNKRNVALTKAGECLMDETSKILNQLEFVKRRLKLIQDGEEGELRIGHPGSAIHSVLPKILSEIQEKFPKIRTILSESLESDLLKAIINHQSDIGFVRESFLSTQFDSKVIYSEQLALVLPDNHPISEENFVNIAQFKDEKFILAPRETGMIYYNNMMKIFERGGFAPNIIHESNYGATILRLVEHNLGVSILPISYQLSMPFGVKFIELKSIPETTHLSVVWLRDNTNPMIKIFLDICESMVIPK
jgi:LysR family transcriptional regulator, benzoate and cis,cis-muconate-responsive activator of ben and cat genes